jgi:hypothetical protein
MRIARLSLAIAAVAPNWVHRPLMFVYDRRLSSLMVGHWPTRRDRKESFQEIREKLLERWTWDLQNRSSRSRAPTKALKANFGQARRKPDTRPWIRMCPGAPHQKADSGSIFTVRPPWALSSRDNLNPLTRFAKRRQSPCIGRTMFAGQTSARIRTHAKSTRGGAKSTYHHKAAAGLLVMTMCLSESSCFVALSNKSEAHKCSQ